MDGTANFLSALRGFNKDDPYQFLRPEPVTQGGGDTSSPAGGGGSPTGNIGAGLLAGSAFGGGGLGSLGGGLGGAQANPYTPPAANNSAPVASAPGTTSFLNSLGRAGAAPAGLAGAAGTPAAPAAGLPLGAGGGGGGGGYSGQVDYGHGLNSSNTVGNPNDINPNTGMNYWDWMQMYQDRGYPMNSVGPNDKGGYTSPDGWDPVSGQWGNAFTSFDSQPAQAAYWAEQSRQNNPNAAGYTPTPVTASTPDASMGRASTVTNPSSANPAMGAVGGPGSYGYDENKYYGR